MSAHVKVFRTNPDVTCLEKDEASVREAIGLICLTFNRDTGDTGNFFVEINGKRALYNSWFMTFYKWFGSGWAMIRNPQYYFEH